MPRVIKAIKEILLILFGALSLVGCRDTIATPENHEAYQKKARYILDVNFEDDLIIPISINNVTYNFLIDTGSSVTIIDNKLAKKITQPLLHSELPNIYLRDFTRLMGVSGNLEKTQFNLFKPIHFKIGTTEIRDNDVWIGQNLSLLSQSIGQDLAGIIGIDTIRKFNWIIDNEHRRITISQDAPPASTFQHCTEYISNYNHAPELEFSFMGKSIYLPLDTGATYNYLDNSFINHLNSARGNERNLLTIDNMNSQFIDATGNTEAPTYIIKGFSFKGLQLGETFFDINKNDRNGVGMDFLSRLNRYAIMPGRIMFCYDTTSIERKGIKSNRHLGVRYINNHIEFFGNKNSELQELNIYNGDIINKINGIHYPPKKIQQVRRILSSEQKGSLSIEIIRKNKKITIKI